MATPSGSQSVRVSKHTRPGAAAAAPPPKWPGRATPRDAPMQQSAGRLRALHLPRHAHASHNSKDPAGCIGWRHFLYPLGVVVAPAAAACTSAPSIAPRPHSAGTPTRVALPAASPAPTPLTSRVAIAWARLFARMPVCVMIGAATRPSPQNTDTHFRLPACARPRPTISIRNTRHKAGPAPDFGERRRAVSSRLTCNLHLVVASPAPDVHRRGEHVCRADMCVFGECLASGGQDPRWADGGSERASATIRSDCLCGADTFQTNWALHAANGVELAAERVGVEQQEGSGADHRVRERQFGAANNVDVYTLRGKLTNCGGGGQCGTCVVDVVEGAGFLTPRAACAWRDRSPSAPNRSERGAMRKAASERAATRAPTAE
eukprot:ctg_1721.g408